MINFTLPIPPCAFHSTRLATAWHMLSNDLIGMLWAARWASTKQAQSKYLAVVNCFVFACYILTKYLESNYSVKRLPSIYQAVAEHLERHMAEMLYNLQLVNTICCVNANTRKSTRALHFWALHFWAISSSHGSTTTV